MHYFLSSILKASAISILTVAIACTGNSKLTGSQSDATDSTGTTSDIPEVVTMEISNITTASAKAEGKVVDNGGARITERGFCWDTVATPTIDNNSIEAGTIYGSGKFTAELSGLDDTTTYYLRAYARNESGIAYSDEQAFSTNKAPGPPTVTIDLEDEYQTIHGFGASDAWSTQFVGKNWPLDKKKQIADLLFSSEVDGSGNPKGIGLSIWRFNIGAGSARQGDESGIGDPWRRAESFLTADSTYNWDEQEGQQWFLNAAHERGVKKFIGFVNSPPVLLTKNGKAYGNGSGQANISADHYDEFADYLAKVANHFKGEGTPLSYISPVNEPQWDWSQGNGQEGSPYQNSQISGVVSALDKKLQAYNLDTKIEIPETAQIDYLYGGSIGGRSHQIDYFFGADSDIKNLPSVANKMAGHSYFTTWPVTNMIEKRQQIKEEIESAGNDLEYWMSEYCILADNEEIQGNGRDLGIDPALYVARVMHYDLTVANASSWQWWLGVSPYDYKDGLVYIDKDTQNGQFYDSKLLWGVGNYSRFIRPGAVRLGVKRPDNYSQGPRELMISAYKNEDDQKLVIVVINYGAKEREIQLDIDNGQQISELIPYVTSQAKSLQKGDAIKNDENLIISGRSIITFISDIK